MNIDKLRADFPILTGGYKGKPIIYFDNACMTLRPKQVVEAVNQYYYEFPACAGRSTHRLAHRVEGLVDESRKTLHKFFGSRRQEEIVFSKNTTESLNLVYNSLDLNKGDVIITTDKEHNSNLLPVQQLVRNKGCIHKFPKSTEEGLFNLEEFENIMNENKGNVKLVSVVHTSNMDGTTVPIKEIVKIAHGHDALVMIDAAQTAPHKELDVKKLDVDFIACSGHKMLGPSGIGVLYGKYDLLAEMKPFIVGGQTVLETWYDKANFETPPLKFEAGLQHYAGILGLGAAAKYLKCVGLSNIAEHEQKLNRKISDELLADDRISVIGPKTVEQRSGIFSFNIKGVEPVMISTVLDETYNIMTRSGYHCVHSWFNANNIKGSVRASLYFYNTEEECRQFIDAVKTIIENFSK